MKNLLFIAVLPLLILSSCSQEKDPGTLITSERALHEFHSIDIDGCAEVFLIQNAEYDIRIETGEYRMPFLKTENKGDKLHIWEKNNKYSNGDLKIWINIDSIEGIEIDGSATVSGSDLVSKNLFIDINGSGDIDLSVDAITTYIQVDGSGHVELWGTSPDLDINIDGSAQMHLRNYEAQHGSIEISGSGKVDCFTSESINAVIDGSGDIHYWGNPSMVSQHVSGSGSIVRR